MSERDDLRVLHCMAIANLPQGLKERETKMEAYRKHKEYCIYKYGFGVAYHAEQYGLEQSEDKA